MNVHRFCLPVLGALLLSVVWCADATAVETLDAERFAERDLLPMSSRDARSVRPSTFEEVRSSASLSGREARFRFHDSADDIQLRFSPEELRGNAFPVYVTSKGKALDVPPLWIGFRPLVPGFKRLQPDDKAKVTVEKCVVEKLPNGCRWECTLRIAGRKSPVPVTILAEAAGKSVRLQINASGGFFKGTTLKWQGGQSVPAVYQIWPTFYFSSAPLYGSVVNDLWNSNYRWGNSAGSRYDSLSDGSYRPLQDVYYLTFSSRYEETIANVPHEPSPYLEEFAGRVLLNMGGGSFAEDKRMFETMSLYGIDRLLVIKHVWQRDGYDRSYPNVFPANAKQGGDEGLRALVQAAKSLGHRFCVHENLYDVYPNAEAFCEADCALGSDGVIQGGWDRGPVTAKVLKPTKLMEYAKRFSPEIVRRYGCNAAYHDIMPSWLIDQDAKVPDSGIARVTHGITRQLCDYARKLFDGPILCEAADNKMAGMYDGGTAREKRIETFPFLPITELLKVHPKMSNHGMSYYERWLEWGYEPGWHWYLMTNRQRDKYRAMTIAFGRMGFIGKQLLRSMHGVVREYHLMQAFGRAYTGRQAVKIRYRDGDRWLDPGTAARLGKWQRLNVTYEGGQEVYVNAGDSPWTVEGVTLPQYGTLTCGPRSVAWTALVDGQIADYARYDDTTYVDARSHTWLPDPRTEVKVQNFKDLGDGKFQISLAWKIPKKLSGDYRVFQHYRQKGKIAFQRVYYPQERTPQWKPGEWIVDRTLTFTVPKRTEEAKGENSEPLSYKLFVGLFNKQGHALLADQADELAVGTLQVSPDRRTVTFKPGVELPHGVKPGPYLVDVNRERRVLKFPGIATNGAAVLKHGERSSRIIPVPVTETMTIGLPGEVSGIQSDDGTIVSTSFKDGWTWFETDGKSKFYRFNDSGQK